MPVPQMMVPMPMQMPMPVPYPYAMMQPHPQYNSYITDAGSGAGKEECKEEEKEEQPKKEEQPGPGWHPEAAAVGADPQKGWTTLADPQEEHFQTQRAIEQDQQLQAFLAQQQQAEEQHQDGTWEEATGWNEDTQQWE